MRLAIFDDDTLISSSLAFIRYIQSLFLNKSVNIHISGPDSVKNSLIRGLVQVNTKYTYNPKFLFFLPKKVLVLSNVPALKTAINLKIRQKIDTLIAGPNIVTIPTDFENILRDRNIDIIIVPSIWVKNLYIKIAPELKNKIIVWYAGVDVEQWKPKGLKKQFILIYLKTVKSPELVNKIYVMLRKEGIIYKIIKYGEYTQREYCQLLNQAIAVIYISESESQGIALAESWSMNVPTFVNKISNWNNAYGIHCKADAAPYLNEKLGQYWTTVNQLKMLISSQLNKKAEYFPRKWVLANMTDKIAADNLLKIIQGF